MPRMAGAARVADESYRWIAATLFVGTLISAAVLLVRRLGGHFSHLLSPAAACAVAVLLCMFSMAGWLVLTQLERRVFGRMIGRSEAARVAAAVLVLVPPFAAGLLVLRPGSTVGLAALAALFITAATAMALVDGASAQRVTERKAARGERAIVEESASSALVEPAPPSCGAPLLRFSKGNVLTQWMTRSVESGGCESIEGAVRLGFAAGAKKSVAHVAFWPPLCAAPNFDCHLLDDAAVRVKAAEVRSYGVRIEAQRTETEAEQTVEVAFSARACLPQSKAA